MPDNQDAERPAATPVAQDDPIKKDVPRDEELDRRLAAEAELEEHVAWAAQMNLFYTIPGSALPVRAEWAVARQAKAREVPTRDAAG
jgi:hypothetical protein